MKNGVEDALKGGGIVAVVAMVLSIALHALIVPPVLERIANSSVIPPAPPETRVEVELKPLPPPPPPKKKAKVARPKGVSKPKPSSHPQPILKPVAPPKLSPLARSKPLPNTFATSTQKPQPTLNRHEETVAHPVEPPKPVLVGDPLLGVKEPVAAITEPLKPLPPPTPPPPVGPTVDAEPTFAPKPHIPRTLLQKVGENDVKLRFIVAPDGSFQVSLVTSSGNPELDQSALQTCRGWRWKPALRNGVPYTRVVNERIEFIVT